MLIDWFTVGAQIINFLILVWLLKRFLYRPVLNAIDAREGLIAKTLADALKQKTQGEQKCDEFAHKNKLFDEERAALLSKATDAAQVEYDRLFAVAKQAAAVFTAKQEELLVTKEHDLHQVIGKRTQQEVFAVIRKTLADLANTSLEEQLSAAFIKRLRTTDLTKFTKPVSDPVLIRSAFELGTQEQAMIQNALNEIFSVEVHIHFEIMPELISGIELVTNEQKIVWSIDDYLATMERNVAGFLQDLAQSKLGAL